MMAQMMAMQMGMAQMAEMMQHMAAVCLSLLIQKLMYRNAKRNPPFPHLLHPPSDLVQLEYHPERNSVTTPSRQLNLPLH